MHLLIEGYDSGVPARDAELLYCLAQNTQNPMISCVHLFITEDSVSSQLTFKSDRLNVIRRSQRPTVYELFEYANKELAGKVCIIANSDIVFDSTLDSVDEYLDSETVLALSRWEHAEEAAAKSFRSKPEIHPMLNAASQDCWIFSSPIRISDNMDFRLGMPGADNRLARLLLEQNYVVSNPADSIVALHMHQSDHRTYSAGDTVPGPYACLEEAAVPGKVPRPILLDNF